MKSDDKIPTGGGQPLGQNPFGALSGENLPAFAKTEKKPGVQSTPSAFAPFDKLRASADKPETKNRGRVDIVRETNGRGGKTVTVVGGFIGIGLPEKEALAKKMRAACGCGGTVKDGQIEIQGDQRETVAKILTAAGFRPVFAGG
ncbi:MAG: translation initiation factor [Opitutaceae bacterium]|jgi:translation initiation factor 1